MSSSILVAGIGNIFQGDDGFGVEVVRRLALRPLPHGVEVVDFGIRGFDLALALLDGKHEQVFLVDLVQRGGSPGTLYLIAPEIDAPASRDSHDMDRARDLIVQTHGMDPASVLSWIQASGGKTDNIRLIGCEPENLGALEDVLVGLSPAVEASVDPAVNMLERLISEKVSESQGRSRSCTSLP